MSKEKVQIVSHQKNYELRDSDYTHEELLASAKENKLFLSTAEFKALFVEKAMKLIGSELYAKEIAEKLYYSLVRYIMNERFIPAIPIIIDNFGTFMPEVIERTRKKKGKYAYVLITFIICNKFKEYFDQNKPAIIKRSLKLIKDFVKVYGEVPLINKTN